MTDALTPPASPAPDGVIEHWPPFRHVVAEIIVALGWKNVAAKIRRYGWREGSEDLIGRIDRTLQWGGYRQPQYHDAADRMQRARAVLTVLHDVATTRATSATVDGVGVCGVDYVHPAIRDDASLGAREHVIDSWKVDVAIECAFDVFMVGVNTVNDAVQVIETKCAELWHACGPSGPVQLCLDGWAADAIIAGAFVAATSHRLTLSEISERLGVIPAEMQAKLRALEKAEVVMQYEDNVHGVCWWTLRPTVARSI